MERKLVITEDGSHTFFVPELNEHYHSIHGAVGESSLIFIQEGVRAYQQHGNRINVLEVGFGTGLNAMLTVIEARERHLRVNYVAVEPYPLADDELKQLNYPGIVGSCNERVLFWELHHTPVGVPYYINDDFILLKLEDRIQEIQLQQGQFQLVYFDAFSPEVQPEMWTAELFTRIHDAMSPGAVLMTYSAKGEVKRNLKAAGFGVETLAGPPGKREITRAVAI